MSRLRRGLVLAKAIVLLLLLLPLAAAAISFESLGKPTGVTARAIRAWDVSADGSVVVGTMWIEDGFATPPHAYRWQGGVYQDLGQIHPTAHEGEAYAVSDDGSKVVGWAVGASGVPRAFVWTAATGMQELPLPGSDAKATGISRDGSVIVGYFFVDAEGSWHAFEWRNGAFTDLGFLARGRDSKAMASCNATAVVGSTLDANQIQRAFRWRATTGMVNLGGIGKNPLAYAEDCSDDGNVVAGTSMDDKGNLLATRWDAAGPRSLGTLGGTSSEAHATTANGSVVVGGAGLPFVGFTSEFSAFRWTTATARMEQLSRTLQNAGVPGPWCHQIPCPAGTWFLSLALGISPDANVIVGEGTDPSGFQQAWRIVVNASSPTPAPSPAPPPGGTSCPSGSALLTLSVTLATTSTPPGAVSTKQAGTNGSVLRVASGQTGSACFQSNKTYLLQTDNARLANWSGSPAISCKNGNTGQPQCEFNFGSTGQAVTSTLR
jgi:probable HAF family extracellular repeat protein